MSPSPGALDRQLEDESIDVGDVSGSSACALNGAALLPGLIRSGRAGAREYLRRLWHGVVAVGLPMSWLLIPLRKPGFGLWDDAMPVLSPYPANPSRWSRCVWCWLTAACSHPVN